VLYRKITQTERKKRKRKRKEKHDSVKYMLSGALKG